jgi:hypothetical protein
MSVAHHQQAAERDDEEAAAATTGCGTDDPRSDRPCWSQTVEHAAEHRRFAAEHRAAARALVDAEERACVGIDEANRDTSPFAHRADIVSAAPLMDTISQGDAAPIERVIGATVVFRAVPGLTAEWLQREIDCHLARSSAVGHDMPEMPDCPLVPALTAHVRSTGDGFAVDIRGADDAGAHEILQRAERLVTPSGV